MRMINIVAILFLLSIAPAGIASPGAMDTVIVVADVDSDFPVTDWSSVLYKPKILLILSGTMPDEVERVTELTLMPITDDTGQTKDACVVFFETLMIEYGEGIPYDASMKKFVFLDDGMTLVSEEQLPTLIDPYLCKFKE